jgi:hypothetical protein
MSTEQPIKDCDGAFWYLTKEVTNDAESIVMNAELYKLRGADKIKETEIGYKYCILLFRESEVEYTKAYLGDMRGYMDRVSKIGYGGLIVKDGSVPARTVKNMIKKVLDGIQMPENEIKAFLKQV